MSRPVVFLTGATGFLGMETLARLLERGDRDVVCLVRAADQAAAEERLAGVLAKLWDDPAPYAPRVRAIAGDVTRPALGMEPAARAALAEEAGAILHCAATITFDLPLEEAREINVEGTREVIGFAREARAHGGLERFVHVSTAYVSGRHPGAFGEEQLDTGQEFRNTYEQTKWEAEHLLAEEAADLAPAIARPSIVMGDAHSGWTPAFNVLYWPLRAFARGLFDNFPARPEGHVDVVTVDYVAEGLIELLDSSQGGVFNLVAADGAPRVDELVGLACARFERPAPRLLEPGTPEADAVNGGHGHVFLPYFEVDTVFDDTRAASLLRPKGIHPTSLRECFGALMDYADAVGWGKSSMTREAAARRRGAAPAAA
jgi:thioester reductase-like protein